MKLSHYRMSGGVNGRCVVGVEITAGNRSHTSGPAQRFHVRVEGSPGNVARFVPAANYAIRKMQGDERRDYLKRLARDWQAWNERNRSN